MGDVQKIVEKVNSLRIEYKLDKGLDLYDKKVVCQTLRKMFDEDQKLRFFYQELLNENNEVNQKAINLKFKEIFDEQSIRHIKTLKKILSIHKWIDVSKFGKGPNSQAFILIQHADNDLEFQEEMLSVIFYKAKEKETQLSQFPMLYDRVMVKKNGVQKFGTQLFVDDTGELNVYSLESLEKVDEWRSEYDLEPLGTYIQRFSEYYRKS